MNYELILKLQDYMSGPLMRISGLYNDVETRFSRFSRNMGRGFTNAGQTVERLRSRLFGLRSGGAVIEGIDRLLGRLAGRRVKLSVDSSELERANERAAKLDKNGRLRTADGRFAGSGGGGSGGGRSGGFGGFGGNMVGGLMRQALPYVGAAAIGGAALSFGNKAMAYERDQFGLGVMLKSQSQAADMMGQFEAFAKKNPLMGLSEVTGAGKRLVSLNERTDRIMPIISMLSDISAGTNNRLSDVQGVLGQVKSKGKLYAQENLQFQERNINLNPYLARVLGIKESGVAKAMEQGRVGYEQVLRAMNLMTSKGGVYEKMSEKVGSQTSYGRLQNLLETLELMLTKLAVRVLPYVNKGLEFLTGLLDGLEKQMNGPMGAAFLAMTDGVSSLGKSIWQFATDVGLVGTKAGETGILMTGLIEGLKGVGNVARWIGWILEKAGPVLKLMPLIGLPNQAAKLFNQASDAMFGPAKIAQKEAPKQTTEEKWVKANNLTDLPANEQHQRFLEARWRNSQNLAFQSLKKEEQHKRFLEAQARAMKGNTSLLGQSGMMELPDDKKKKKGTDTGVTAAAQGARSTNITINVNKLVEQLTINAASVSDGISDMEARVTDALLRVLNSSNALQTN